MTAKWHSCTLGDVVTLQRGIDLPAQERQSGSIPVVASTGVVGFHNKSAAKGPGVVIGRSGSIEGGQFIREDFWPLNTTLWVKDFHGNIPRFCYYLLKSIDFSGLNAGSGVPTLNRNHLHTIPIFCPSIKTQRLIADYLGSLDDKIELNRKLNQTLEALAQAIFKSWFVDFEPTKAKIAARKQGQDPLRAAMCAISGKNDSELNQLPQEDFKQLAATAALFPDAMEQSELGKIPKGWNIKSIQDLAQFVTGKIETASLTVRNYISTENMLSNKNGICHAASLPTSANVPAFKNGHILISNIRPYFKKIWLASFEGGHSNDVLCFEAKEDGYKEFLYNLLYQDDFFEFMTRTSKGAKMPRGDKNAIASWPFPCAKKELMHTFSEKVREFYLYIEALNIQSNNLSKLRDTLLPKLLSGELIIPADITDEKIL